MENWPLILEVRTVEFLFVPTHKLRNLSNLLPLLSILSCTHSYLFSAPHNLHHSPQKKPKEKYTLQWITLCRLWLLQEKHKLNENLNRASRPNWNRRWSLAVWMSIGRKAWFTAFPIKKSWLASACAIFSSLVCAKAQNVHSILRKRWNIQVANVQAATKNGSRSWPWTR